MEPCGGRGNKLLMGLLWLKWPVQNDELSEKDINANKEMHCVSEWVTKNRLIKSVKQ